MVKVFRWIVNALFITFISILLVYFVFRVTNKVEIYSVKTGSMEDKIHVGDYILIYRKKDYKVGDVVTFIRNEGFITHRIIKMDGGKVTTKGDANNTVDEDIPVSNILGKVILVGGILNVIINYKYAFVGILMSLYLLSCYFGDGSEDNSKEKMEDEKNNDVKNEEVKNSKEVVIEKKNESILVNKENLSSDKNLKEEDKEDIPIKKEKKENKKEEIVTEEVIAEEISEPVEVLEENVSSDEQNNNEEEPQIEKKSKNENKKAKKTSQKKQAKKTIDKDKEVKL